MLFILSKFYHKMDLCHFNYLTSQKIYDKIKRKGKEIGIKVILGFQKIKLKEG